MLDLEHHFDREELDDYIPATYRYIILLHEKQKRNVNRDGENKQRIAFVFFPITTSDRNIKNVQEIII